MICLAQFYAKHEAKKKYATAKNIGLSLSFPNYATN